MAYCGNNYYEKEVIRDCGSPCESYSEYSRVESGYGSYPIGHHPRKNVVSEVVCETSTTPSYGNHHHHHHHHHLRHGGAEIFERKEECIVYENDYDPCRTMC